MTKKEKSCLVTQGLISSIDWFLTAPDYIIKPEKGGDGKLTWKDKAHQDLCNTIRRVKTPFLEAAKRGVEFEKKVYEIANKGELKGSEFFQEVCTSVKGYEFYKKGGVYKEISGEQVYLYGKYDAIKPDSDIKDIKTTANYSKGKYLKSFQHKMYCYITGLDEFKYVIAEWDEYPKIKKVHYEEFYVEDIGLLNAEVITTVENAFDILKDLGLWEDYRKLFCLY